MSEQKIKLCHNACCPHLHLNLETGYARITDDYDGEISETIGQMTCVVGHLKDFLNGNEKACSNIIRVDEFIDVFGHRGGKVRIKDSQAQILIDKWIEAVCNGNSNCLDITTPIGENLPSPVGGGA